MTAYRTPEHRSARVAQIVQALQRARRIVLTTHVNADGDGAGCEAALVAWLEARGAQAKIVNPTAYPETFEFLLTRPDAVLDAKSPDAASYCAAADLAIVVDTCEAPRIARVNPLVEALPKVLIDHHQPGESPLDGLALLDPGACASGELVYDILLAADGTWPEPTVTGLYVAVLTDTGSFRFSNATPASHLIAADLLARGVDPEVIFERVYATWLPRRLALLRASLGELETDPEHGLAWMTVPRAVYAELEATSDDLEGFVDYPRSIKGVHVALLFRETDEGHTKVSFRSNGPVDVNALAARFGGGGHVKAAGAYVDGPVAEVRPRVIAAARDAVRATWARRA